MSPVGSEDGTRLNDELECLVSDTDDETVSNNQNGIMFDLTVDELEAAVRIALHVPVPVPVPAANNY